MWVAHHTEAHTQTNMSKRVASQSVAGVKQTQSKDGRGERCNWPNAPGRDRKAKACPLVVIPVLMATQPQEISVFTRYDYFMLKKFS